MNKNIFTSNLRKFSFVVLTAAFLMSGFFVPQSALAGTEVVISPTTPATGGGSISIDTSAQSSGSSFTILRSITITETGIGQISTGVHTFTLPTGWEFNTSAVITAKTGDSMEPYSTNITPDSNSFSFELTKSSLLTNGSLTFDGLQVRPTGTVAPTTGEITHSGAATIAGVGETTSFGTLSTVPGVLAHLKITDLATSGGSLIPASQIISGQSINVYSIGADQFGNFIGNVSATWSLTGITGNNVVAGDLATASDNKSAIFTGHLVGAATIHAEVGTSALTADSGVLTVVSGPVSVDNSAVGVSENSIVVSDGSDPAKLITVNVTAKDAAGNPVEGATASISATDADTTMINPTSASTDSSGQAIFTISSEIAQTETISATVDSTLIGQTQDITFNPGEASQLSIATQPSVTAVAGQAFSPQPVINVLDQFGNVVTDSTADITATKHPDSDTTYALLGTLTATAVNGVATFSDLNYQKATSISIDFTSDSLAPVTSGSIVVSPAAPYAIIFTTQPATVSGETVDNPLSTQPIVSVQDAFGNMVADGASVVLSLSTTPAAQGQLMGTVTKTTTGGIATFTDVKYTKLDSFSITATAGSVSIPSDSIGPLSAGVINSFSISTTSPQTAGRAFDVNVSNTVDQFLNPTSGTVTVSAASGDGDAPSGAHPIYNPITVTAGAGTAQTTLINAVATVLRGAADSVTADSASIIVNPAVPARVVLTANPSSMNATDVASSVITGQLQDQYQNNSKDSGVSVVITKDDAKAIITQSQTLTDTNGQVSATLTAGTERNQVLVNIGATAGTLTVVGTQVQLLDITAPAAPIITTPVSPVVINAANKDTQTISGTAEADSTVKIYVDGAATSVITVATTGGNFAFTNEQLVTAGIVSATDYSTKSVTLTATDAQSNQSVASATISYTQDITPPVISITTPAADSVYLLNSLALTGNISITESNSVTCQYEINSGAPVTIDCASGVISGLPEGRQTLTLIATDVATNSSTASVSFVVNTDGILTVGASGADFTTIQEAINKAAVNDTISVTTGTYNEDVTINKNLKIIGIDNPTATSFALSNSAVLSAGSGGITALTITVNANSKIQDGVLLASSGGTVNIMTGVYIQTTSINIDKEISIVGVGEEQTTIDISEFNGYGIELKANNVTLEGFTLQGDENVNKQYPIHAFSSSRVTGLTIRNVTVKDSYRTGIDLNSLTSGVQNRLKNIIVTGADYGFGLTLSGCQNVVVEDITTNDNAWGDVGIFPSNQSAQETTGIVFSGTLNLSGGNGVITIQPNGADYNTTEVITYSTADSGDALYNAEADVIVPSDYNRVVYGLRSDGLKNYILMQEDDAVTIAQGLAGSADFSDLTIRNMENGHWEVVEGLLIQDAITAASADATVNVAAGTYNELLNVNVNGLTLLGAQADVDPRPMNNGRTGAESIIQKMYTTDTLALNPIKIEANNVTINGFTITPYYEEGVVNLNKDLVKQEPDSWVGTTIKYNILTATGYNIVDNCDELIQLKGVTDAVIEYNYGYHSAESDSGGNAFSLSNSADSVIQNNEAHLCGDYQLGKFGGAIYTYTSDNINVIGNKIVGGGGITFGGSRNTHGLIYLNTGGIVENNIVEDSDFGLEIFAKDITVSGNNIVNADYFALSIIGVNVIVSNNNLYDSETGIVIEDESFISFDTSGISINANKIYSNTVGLENLAGVEVNAINNWWGTTDEITITSKISDNVDYRPWSADDSCTPDNDAPYIIDGMPTPSSVGIDPATNIEVFFNDPVQCSNGEWTSCISVINKDSNSIEGDAGYTDIDNDYKLVFTPTGNKFDSNAEYTITFSGIIDMSGNELSPSSPYNYSDNPWIFTTATHYEISLSSGWNLISFPVTPTTWQDVEETLESANGQINGIWTYDAVKKEWSVYTPDREDNDSISSIEAGYGYWVNAEDSPFLTGSGTLYEQLVPSGSDQMPSSLPQVQLGDGWNLIGYYQLPNTESMEIEYALSKLDDAWSGNGNDLITFKKGTLEPITPIYTMEPGIGYWIFMKNSVKYSFGNTK